MEALSSSAWTGDDPFAALSPAERHDAPRFNGTRRRLNLGLAVAAAVGLGGLIATAASLQTSNLATAAGGAVIAVSGARVAWWLRRRLAASHRTAPLVLAEHHFSAGQPPRSLRYDAVEAVDRPLAGGLGERLTELLYLSPFWMWRRYGLSSLPIVQLKPAAGDPLILDLELLEGDPQRTATILSYRIEAAKQASTRP